MKDWKIWYFILLSTIIIISAVWVNRCHNQQATIAEQQATIAALEDTVEQESVLPITETTSDTSSNEPKYTDTETENIDTTWSVQSIVATDSGFVLVRVGKIHKWGSRWRDFDNGISSFIGNYECWSDKQITLKTKL